MMIASLFVNFPFHCGTCVQEEFSEPANLDVNNKRFKSKTTKGMLERVLLMISFKGDTCISGASTGGECCDAIWDNSIFIASFNSCLIISKLHLFSSSTFLLHAS